MSEQAVLIDLKLILQALIYLLVILPQIQVKDLITLDLGLEIKHLMVIQTLALLIQVTLTSIQIDLTFTLIDNQLFQVILFGTLVMMALALHTPLQLQDNGIYQQDRLSFQNQIQLEAPVRLVIGTLQVDEIYQEVMGVYIHRIAQVIIGLDIILQELQIQLGIKSGQIKLLHPEITYHQLVVQ